MKSFHLYSLIGVICLSLFFGLANSVIINYEDIQWQKSAVSSVIILALAFSFVIGISLLLCGISDWRYHNKYVKAKRWDKVSGVINSKGFFVLSILFITLGMQSCAANGYGCHGRSKIMTRVK